MYYTTARVAVKGTEKQSQKVLTRKNEIGSISQFKTIYVIQYTESVHIKRF